MIPSLIRTYVPLLVAYVVGWLVSLGIPVTDDAQSALTAGIGTVVAALYYTAVRFAERKWPALTVLLGSTEQPAAYTTAAPTAPAGRHEAPEPAGD